MKVLLVSCGGSSPDFSMSEKRFPIGLGCLSAMLKQRKHSVCLVDRFADPGDWVDDVHSFDFVGVYTNTPCYADALRVLELLGDYEGPIAFGGPHTTLFPRTIPPRVDYVVQGEAEWIINDLVKGVYPSGSLIRTPRIQDLDALPRVDYDLFLARKRSYEWTIPFTESRPIFVMNTSRSCPFACEFCAVRQIWGRLWTAQSAERVVEDVLFLKSAYHIAGVYFREDNFTADRGRVHRIAELLIERNADIVWACEARPDLGEEPELIRLMARSGCRGLYVGAESGSPRMLKYYNKQITVDQIVRTCRLAKKYDIAVAMSLITGHPRETRLDLLATRALVRLARPEIVWTNPYRDEFTRHGRVDFPVYPARQVIHANFEGGSWKGQRDRVAPPGAELDPGVDSA